MVAALQSILELSHVAVNDLGVEPQLGGTEDQIGGVQVASQSVAGLLQQTAPVRGVALRPQVSDELVATDAVLRGGKEREEGERFTVGGRAVGQCAVNRDGQPAKGAEFQHGAPFDPRLTRSSPARPTLRLVPDERHQLLLRRF